MLWHMLSRPGMVWSPLARPALMSLRAMSGRVEPRASRCWRSQAPSSADITPSFAVRRLPDTDRVREPLRVSWAGAALVEQVVGEAGLGAGDEGADLVGF